jgi:hypothetical protein
VPARKAEAGDGSAGRDTCKLLHVLVDLEAVVPQDTPDQARKAAAAQIEGPGHGDVVYEAGVDKAVTVTGRRYARARQPHELVGQDRARHQPLRQAVSVRAEAGAGPGDFRRAAQAKEQLEDAPAVDAGVKVPDVRGEDERLAQVGAHVGEDAAAGHAAYGGRCAVTGCDAVAALEASHIVPYCGPQSHHVTNGLLLRADLHTLFDLDLMGIDPDTMTVALAPAIKGTTYSEFQGRRLTLPAASGWCRAIVARPPQGQALTWFALQSAV